MLQIDTQSYLPWNETNFTHTSVRDSGNVTATIATASRYPMAVGEAAASNGVYLKGDEKITFALNALAFVPKPRDLILPPGETTTAVVLEVTKNSFLKFWELLVRNLIIAHDLKDVATIRRSTPSPTDTGTRERNPSDFATNVPCRLQPDSTEIDLGEDRVTQRKRYTCFIGQPLEIEAGDTIVVDGVEYEATEQSDIDQYDTLTRVACERLR